MKFDTPATTNPIDQLKVVGKPTDRIDGPLKTTGTAPYAYERHDVAPNAAYGYVVGAAIAKGRIASIDTSRAKAAPGVLASSPPPTPASSARGFNTAKLLGGPEIEHYHQASRWSSPRPSSRRAPPRSWSASTTRAPRAPSTWPPPRTARQAKPRAPAARRHRGRRLRRRLRRRAGQARRRPTPRPTRAMR
jgi:hypothetical protein